MNGALLSLEGEGICSLEVLEGWEGGRHCLVLPEAQETPASTLRLIPGSRPNNETQKTGTENMEQREVRPGL